MSEKAPWPARLPFYYGWVIIAVAFVTMALGVSARTAFSLLMPPLIDEFGWDRGLASGAFSFGFLVSEVRTVAERELARLSRISDQSAEHQVIRTYLDWILDIPWGVETTDDLDLDNTVIFRTKVEKADWKPRWNTKPNIDIKGALPWRP